MSYLETRNFIHRDLKAEHILLGKDSEVKVAGFAFARSVGTDVRYVDQIGKPK